MNSLSDNELQILYVGSNEAAARESLEEMRRRNEVKLRDKALRLCSFHQSDADDLYQEAALHFWTRREKYTPGPAPWIAWAVRVMCGCASDQRKKRQGKLASRTQPIGQAADLIAGNELPPDLAAFNHEFGSAVRDCIGLLESEEPELHKVFFMHFDGGETFQRVTEILKLGHGPTPAKSRYDKAIKRLGSCLRTKGFGSEDRMDKK